MSTYQEQSKKVNSLIRSFKNALRKYNGNYENRKYSKHDDGKSFYEEAKKAETEERNLFKALELYLKSIQHGEKKDSTIKDFSSSLHQLGFTKEAVNLMDDCEPFYHGNKSKYFRLRDNLSIQIKPTGKHLCRFLLIENLCHELKTKNSEEIKDLLFKSTKRIKEIKFYENFQLEKPERDCQKQFANNLLVEFESFSAAKKTLESFCFQEWFGSNLYWVSMSDMRIVCSAADGKRDFEDGFIVTQDVLNEEIWSEKEMFWSTFGEKVYSSKESNGFMNLLASHLIKQNGAKKYELQQNKENIFESSKVMHKKIQAPNSYEHPNFFHHTEPLTYIRKSSNDDWRQNSSSKTPYYHQQLNNFDIYPSYYY